MNLQTFVISYETDQATWKLYLIAESKEDALKFLMDEVGNKAEGFRVNNFEAREQIHAVTPTVIEKLTPPQETVIDSRLICPWCKSIDYVNAHALKMHIVKAHTGKAHKPKPKKEK